MNMAPDYFTLTAITLPVLVLSSIFIFLDFRNSRDTKPYEAPIERTGDHSVCLRPDYSLQQHSAAISYIIEKHMYRLTGQLVYEDRIVYVAEDVGPEMLATIRADNGVESVSPDYLRVPEPALPRPLITGEGPPAVYGKTILHDPSDYDPSSPLNCSYLPSNSAGENNHNNDVIHSCEDSQ